MDDIEIIMDLGVEHNNAPGFVYMNSTFTFSDVDSCSNFLETCSIQDLDMIINGEV